MHQCSRKKRSSFSLKVLTSCHSPHTHMPISLKLSSGSVSTNRHSDVHLVSPSLSKQFSDIEGLISSCGDLQSEISEITNSLKRKLSIPNILNLESHEHQIRNESYLKASKVIANRLRMRKTENLPPNLTNITRGPSTHMDPLFPLALTQEDITCNRTTEFLTSSRRGFGEHLPAVKEHQARSKHKKKSTDIKINPEATIKSLNYPKDPPQLSPKPLPSPPETSHQKKKFFKSLLTKGKHKLPQILFSAIASAQARSDANFISASPKALQPYLKSKFFT